jgi:hypothetical protein
MTNGVRVRAIQSHQDTQSPAKVQRDAKVQPTVSEHSTVGRFCRGAIVAVSTGFGPPEDASDLSSEVALPFSGTKTRQLTEADRQMLMAHVSHLRNSCAYGFCQSALIPLSPPDVLRLCEVLRAIISPLLEVTVEGNRSHTPSRGGSRVFSQVGRLPHSNSASVPRVLTNALPKEGKIARSASVSVLDPPIDVLSMSTSGILIDTLHRRTRNGYVRSVFA